MQLEPGEYFGIVRQLQDPNDTGTYYVQAKIRNARTGTLLDTVNLTDLGGQYFFKEWQVFSNVSGPTYISISTRVYTNSIYTTLSDGYGQEVDTYLVEPRAKHVGGGGGSGVNYTRIDELVKAAIIEHKTDKVDHTAALAAITEALKILTGSIAGIDFNPQINVQATAEITPVLEAVSGVGAALKALTDANGETPGKIDAAVAKLEKAVEDAKSGLLDELKSSSGENKKAYEELMVIVKQGNLLEFIQGIANQAVENASKGKPVLSPYEIIKGFNKS